MNYPITQPGVYDVPEAEYHGREICDSPSVSSSGLRAIQHCPAKYWWNSPLNPNRTRDGEARHFSVGRAAHELVLDGAGWPDRYHVLPEGFNGAATKKWAVDIEYKQLAEAAGKIILRYDDAMTVNQMAAVFKRHPISKALGRGKAERTIVWKDVETGVWLRCRPDFLPTDMKFVPDFKTTTDASPKAFERDVAAYGYNQQAALYLDGFTAVFGEAHRQFYFIAQEKEAPYVVQPYYLDAESIEWGRKLNRKAIRTFARCLEKNEWPGYSSDFLSVSLPAWQVKILNDAEQAGETQ